MCHGDNQAGRNEKRSPFLTFSTTTHESYGSILTIKMEEWNLEGSETLEKQKAGCLGEMEKCDPRVVIIELGDCFASPPQISEPPFSVVVDNELAAFVSGVAQEHSRLGGERFCRVLAGGHAARVLERGFGEYMHQVGRNTFNSVEAALAGVPEMKRSNESGPGKDRH